MACPLAAWRPLRGLPLLLLVLCVAACLKAPAAAEVKKGPSVPANTRFLLDRVPAFHWRTTWYSGWDFYARREPEGPPQIERVEEGWVVRDRGCRFEVRRGSKLTLVIVQTPRWRFHWDVAASVVTADPGNPSGRMRSMEPIQCGSREELLPWAERAKGTWVSEKERRDGKEVEKITLRFLADPSDGFQSALHGFVPELHQQLLDSPKAEFRTRTWWFDPKTRLQVGHRCGCKPPKHDDWIDFPSPESVPKELFKFEVPRGATLEVNDPELGRVIHSEAQKGPDLRQ